MVKELYERLIDHANEVDGMVGFALAQRRGCLKDQEGAAIWADYFHAHNVDLKRLLKILKSFED